MHVNLDVLVIDVHVIDLEVAGDVLLLQLVVVFEYIFELIAQLFDSSIDRPLLARTVENARRVCVILVLILAVLRAGIAGQT